MPAHRPHGNVFDDNRETGFEVHVRAAQERGGEAVDIGDAGAESDQREHV